MKRNRLVTPPLIVLFALVAFATVSTADDDLSWHTFEASSASSAGGFKLTGTAGQPDAGVMSGDDFALASGFWAAPVCRADLTGDGEVGFDDLLRVLAAWDLEDVPEDLDGNGVVDFGDMLIILASWGPCEA